MKILKPPQLLLVYNQMNDSNLKHSFQLRRGFHRGGGSDDGVELRREHAHVVRKVADEGNDVHSLREPLDLAEQQHEAVLLCQLVQWAPLALILSQCLDFHLRRQEPHEALHKVHRQGLEVKPEHKHIFFCGEPHQVKFASTPNPARTSLSPCRSLLMSC